MRWFSNMRIGKKLALGFGMVLVLMAGISALEISASLSMDAGYSYIEEYPSQQRVLWSEVESNFHAARRSVSHSGFFYGRDGHDANVAAMRQAYDRDAATLYDDLSAVRESVQNDSWLMESDKDAMIKSVDDIKAAIDNWREVVADPVINAFAAGDRDTAISIMEANSSIIDGVQENIIANYNEATKLANENSVMMDASVKSGIIIIVCLASAVVIIGVLIAIANTRSITKPINRLVSIVGEVAEGKLNVNIDRNSISKDEIGTLTMGIATLADTILLIVAEIGNLDAEFAAGDIEAQIDTSKFKGSYKEVAEGINATLNELIHEEIVFMNCLIEFGKGNFSADIPKLPGKKVLMNQNIDALRANFKNVADEINTLVGAAGRGELDKRVDISKYSGDWARLLDGLNDLMVAIADPIREANRILNNLAAGDFEHHMHGNYKGDFLMIKNSVNETVTHISSYIKEISAVLGALADNNLNQSITREYVGDFSSIKKSLLNIIKNFNEVISRIYAASDQVASGAHAVSEGSTSMAQGASEQASSIEELNATVQLISESTQQNAQNAGDADSLSKQSKDMAALGDDDMNHMLKSMDGIKASSDGISKIIKVIDDIAFQTNILSLNAAVEAARAGEHGKGFAVVAEEVRNLAVRSQSSARDTAQLIEESISRVNEGMAIAGKTAEALRQIVESVTKVSGIIEGITQASQEQSSAILQVMDGIRQITGVIQNNSSTTEEAASAAEELSSQSEVLRNLVSVFTLRA